MGSTSFQIVLLLMASLAFGIESVSPRAPSFTTTSVAEPELTTANSLSASTTALPTPSYRLPEDLHPEHYTLEIKTFLDGENSRFEGRVLIRVKCEKDTSRVVLHSTDLILNTDQVRVGDKEIIGHDFDTQNEFYIIKLKEELKSGSKYVIEIPFEGNLTTSLKGYYRTSYQDKATGDKKWVATTQFVSVDARRAFPCFDEPAMKAVFQVNMIRRKGFTSISNMPLAKSVQLEDDWFRDEYVESVRMSTYLVAFVVSDFAHLQSNHGYTTFRVWARQDAIEQARYSLEIGPKILDFYEEYFDVPYPLPKMDMIALPELTEYAMENWGMITNEESCMLYEDSTSEIYDKEDVTVTAAHVLAHQWFGNLVTMKWWDDLWLKEGFATYVEGLGTDHVQPSSNYLDNMAAMSLLRIFFKDSLKSSHSVSKDIQNPSEIRQLFDDISYYKGYLVLRMLNYVLGEETFRRGVSKYLKTHQYDNAVEDDLWASFEQQLRDDSARNSSRTDEVPRDATVKEIMDSWTLQTGYPVIHVMRNYEEGSAELWQNRFVTDWLGRSSDDRESLWWVPISYTDPSNALLDMSTKPRFWMNTSNATLTGLPKKDQWLLLNVNATALYRINYDSENWNLLSTALRTEKNHGGIPTLNRVQIIDDAFNLAKAGLLEYNLALNILRYLRHERVYLPWRAAFLNLEYFSRMTKRGGGYGPFRKFVRALLTPVYNALDEPFKPSVAADTLPQIKYRFHVHDWSCSYGVSDCEEKAVALFKTWQQQTEDQDVVNPIPVELRSVVYCKAVESGGEPAWDFVWKRFLSSNVAAEKSKLLSALGCAREMWLLHRFLDMSLNETSGIHKQDIASVFNSVATSSSGFYIAKEFLFSRIKDIHSYVGPDFSRVGKYVESVSHLMSKKNDLEQIKQFVELNSEYLKDAKYTVKEAVENVELNVQWHSKYYPTVIEWFSAHENEELFA
ncbi:aminopeptidase Ey-like [Cloeon dipterum]|uniref:aminopeptidase Ey-like n=1 Tax=Cloeon dipterum TaxID=197152 RepID=UPI0032205B3B